MAIRQKSAQAKMVLKCIVEWLKTPRCKSSIIRFGLTGYSFEEWLNWEIYLACKENAQWFTRPRPRYETPRSLADLSVSTAQGNNEEPVFIEVKQAHECTGFKWVGSIKGDSRKLTGKKQSIQILLVFKHFHTFVDRNGYKSKKCKTPEYWQGTWRKFGRELNYGNTLQWKLPPFGKDAARDPQGVWLCSSINGAAPWLTTLHLFKT